MIESNRVDNILDKQQYPNKKLFSKDNYDSDFNKVLDNHKKLLNSHNNGTDFADKKLAQKVVADMYSQIWKETETNKEVDSIFGGGFAEELLQPELTTMRAYKAFENMITPLSQAIHKLLKKKRDELNEQESTKSITAKLYKV